MHPPVGQQEVDQPSGAGNCYIATLIDGTLRLPMLAGFGGKGRKSVVSALIRQVQHLRQGLTPH